MEIIDAHVHIVPRELLGKTDGRFGLTVEPCGLKRGGGEELRFMPPYFADSAFPAEALLATLDEAGVARAVIQQSFCHYDNEAVAAAVALAPERLSGAMVIEPRDESCLDAMTYWAGRGLRSMKFECSRGLGYTHPNAYPKLRFDTPLFDRVFDRAEALGLTVYRGEANFILFCRETERKIAAETANMAAAAAAAGLKGTAAVGPDGAESREPLGDALLKQGILIRETGDFRGLGPGFYRAAVRTEQENRELLEAISAFLKCEVR